jgi:hypothetical protein
LIFILLTVIGTTIFASFYKIASVQKCNLSIVNAFLYIGAGIGFLLFYLLYPSKPFNLKAFEFGMIAGSCLFFATLAFLYHMQKGQLAVSWTIISLSVGFPVLASIFIWHENPSTKQIFGLATIALSLLLFGRQESKKAVKKQ